MNTWSEFQDRLNTGGRGRGKEEGKGGEERGGEGGGEEGHSILVPQIPLHWAQTPQRCRSAQRSW